MTQHVPLLVPGAKPDGEHVTITAPFDGSNIATIETGGIDAAHSATPKPVFKVMMFASN